MKKEPKITKSSGNVFGDLGLPKAGQAMAKAQLARRIAEIIEGRRLTQVQAAKLLELDQAKVSALVRGELGGFSSDRLFRFLNALDQDVEITIKNKPKSRDGARVYVLAS